MQLNDLLEEFELELQVRNVYKRTIKTYKNNTLQFIAFLKNKYEISELKQVTHKYIKDYATFMQNKGNSASYINNILKCFRAFYKYLIEEEYTEVNPMLKVKWQKQKKTLIETFTDDEVNKMINHYTGR